MVSLKPGFHRKWSRGRSHRGQRKAPLLLLAAFFTTLVCAVTLHYHMSSAHMSCRAICELNKRSSRCSRCNSSTGTAESLDGVVTFQWTYRPELNSLCRNSAVPVQYVIAVNSLPDAVDHRNIIRADLWMARNRSSANKLVFFTGTPTDPSMLKRLEVEMDHYRDLVVGDFPGSPENESLTTLMLLRWTAEFCPATPFLIKISEKGRVSARYLTKAHAHHVRLSKEFDMFGSFVSLRGEPCDEPPAEESIRSCPDSAGFLSGCAYMMTGDLVRPLLRASVSRPPLMPEDAYVTGMLAEAVGARRAELVNFEGCYFSYAKSTPIRLRDIYYIFRDKLAMTFSRLFRFLQGKPQW